MNIEQEQPLALDDRMRQAVLELENTIRRKFPHAAFEVSRAADNPGAVHLIASVDVDDTDEVLDTVIDRVVELQVEEQIPLHVIPVRTTERIAAAGQATRRGRGRRKIPLLSRFPFLSRSGPPGA
jgi:hypothetical protein